MFHSTGIGDPDTGERFAEGATGNVLPDRHVERDLESAALDLVGAARARRLRAEATTPRLKQYLLDVIARCERLAVEVDSASKKD